LGKLTSKQRAAIKRNSGDKAACALAEQYGVEIDEILRSQARKEYAVITPKLRKEIRESCGGNRQQLAAHYNVSISTIRNIQMGKPGRLVGSSNGRAKLTTQEVAAIQASSDRGVDLAAQYGVSAATISNIRAGRQWWWI
jgi:DNA-binding transcriptional regulator YiaG